MVNRRIGEEVNFQDVLHGFWAGRGTGTSSLDAKLLRMLMEMREEVLYEVFLDLLKSDYALERRGAWRSWWYIGSYHGHMGP